MSVKLPSDAMAPFVGQKVVVVSSSGQIKVGTFTGVTSVGMKDCIGLSNPHSLVNISYMESIDVIELNTRRVTHG